MRHDITVLRMTLVVITFFLLAISVTSSHAIEIDRTCQTCTIREKDSVNVYHRRNLRVNQVGYLPEKPSKVAFAAASTGGPFQVIDPKGEVVYAGELQKFGDYPKPQMIALGYANSLSPLYRFASDSGKNESLYRADFSALKTPGNYRIAANGDTSATFLIHSEIYAQALATVLHFFGANRCGATNSWIHGACHLKDGSALGAAFSGRLAGGWHDCGDHGKYAETTAYTALVLSLAYAIWPERAPDSHGASYASKTPDGIPDLLHEAKTGADFIYQLYQVSEEFGLIAQGDMYHSVGMGSGMDHMSWDIPENQDEKPLNLGGPDRPVTGQIGSNVAGSYAATLALFSASWKKQDTAYAMKMQRAAIDIYDRIVMKKLGTRTFMPCCYTGGPPSFDDEAMAALALWYATGEARFGFDLLENTSINKGASFLNDGEFPAGHMGKKSFSRGGWPTDYSSIHAFVLYGLAKLILPDSATATSYGISSVVRDSLLKDVKAALREGIKVGTNGTNSTSYPGIQVDEPYHGLFTSADWGFNRYNLGIVNDLFMYHDLTGNETYASIGIDNLNYLLGANPYDISFIQGCGDRNLQHAHNRAANPDGYNQAGTPYARKTLTGAVMGGVRPGQKLKDEWQDYTSSETCIDFAAQVIFPLMYLSRDEAVVGLRPKSQNDHRNLSKKRMTGKDLPSSDPRHDVLGRARPSAKPPRARARAPE